ncbi:MAG: hypothetical protein U0359_42295 [Byssovorax sp.]
MSFRDFRLPDVLKKFDLRTSERPGLFEDRPPASPSQALLDTLRYNVPLATAMGTEKARSELIIAPVLVELKRSFRPDIALFSGVELSVDPEAGLTGACDFLITSSPEQLFVKAPIVALAEAKNENLRDGMGQCAAEMVAAKIFNERDGTPVETLYGVVTTGTAWKFLSLTGKTLGIDLNEYSISQPDKILGILVSMVTPRV